MENTFEIEIKALLKNQTEANELVARMYQLDPNTLYTDRNRQLNHYFNSDGNFEQLYTYLEEYFNEHHQQQYLNILRLGKHFSVRTREIKAFHLDQSQDAQIQTLFIIKSSVDETSSENGISRLEFEVEIPGVELHQLDQMLLESGFTYQAKWSRERKQYKFLDLNVCLDKNAGYGYLVEFESLVKNREEIEHVRQEIRQVLKKLEVMELPQDKLESMFKYYNDNWQDFYGTEKTFTV